MSDESDIRGLRVLMTTDAVGGVFSYAMNLTRELCRRGAEVVLACMGPEPRRDQHAEVNAVPGLRLEHAPYSLEWMDEPWADVERAGDWLLGIARELGAQLVHLNGYCHATLPWGAPTVVVAHSCIASWWQAVLGTDVPKRHQGYLERVNTGLRHASAVVAPSAAMLKSLRRAHGYTGPASVIFNGISSAEYFRRPKHPFYLAAGRLWDRAKNIELIMSAAAELPWPVRVVGDGFLCSDGSRVQGTGRLTRADLAAIMGSASVFLHPARYEPFGLAPLEAALSGAALVLGRLDSLCEIWGDSALYVSTDDPGELAHAATRLADDAVLRHSLQARAEYRARELSSRTMADNYTQLYRRVLADATRARIPTAQPSTRRVES
ncbi:MAG TPA: glycosyltransferase [Polyangiaceae bacterium]|nr:glycosyltransferase [Polyangiaceae bacterium]